MSLKSPRQKTIKRLFAVSGNYCSFPKCSTSLVDKESGIVTGEICHIKGRKTESPRYDPDQSDEERHDFDNLMLMCPIHHKVIDDDVESYTVARLIDIKSKHEELNAGGDEPNEEIVNQFLLSISKGSLIYTQDQKGGQVAHSIINIGYDDKAKLIQAFFNRIVLFFDNLLSIMGADPTVIKILKDFESSDLKYVFGVQISEILENSTNMIKLLNGRFALQIEILDDKIKYSLMKDTEQIDLSNPIERFKFYEDLQNFATLTTGVQPFLPVNLKNQKEQIVSAQKSFNTLLRMFKKLYRPRSKISHTLVETIHKSEKMRDFFGITAPKPTQQGIPLDDVPIHFLEGKYKLIPNSSTLRIENKKGQYDDLLAKKSTPESIETALNEFFRDITEYVKKEYNIDISFSGSISIDRKGLEMGYCIRCRRDIRLDRAKPYCYYCYSTWAEFCNADYPENYCHDCGKQFKTVIYKPLCDECYRNE